mgnify:CR=1
MFSARVMPISGLKLLFVRVAVVCFVVANGNAHANTSVFNTSEP